MLLRNTAANLKKVQRFCAILDQAFQIELLLHWSYTRYLEKLVCIFSGEVIIPCGSTGWEVTDWSVLLKRTWWLWWMPSWIWAKRTLSFHIRQISYCGIFGGAEAADWRTVNWWTIDDGKTRLRILCLVLFLLVQGESGEIGEDPAEDYEGSLGSRACTQCEG